MNRNGATRVLVLVMGSALAMGGCARRGAPAGGAAAEEPAAAPSNRVDINAMVRQNLGITFARVERRPVARTLRVPGRFELVPTAHREYRAPGEGTVELLVEQYQVVEAGTPLYRLDAPAWREVQRELNDAERGVSLAEAAADSIDPFMRAHERHHAQLEEAVALWEERVASLDALRSAGGAAGDALAQARASLASARADLAETFEKEAELQTRGREAIAELSAARARQRFLLEGASRLTGRTVEELVAGEVPLWRTLSRLDVVALTPGVVDAVHVSSGSIVESGAAIIDTVQTDRVRFRASALQSDLGRLTDGMRGAVVSPEGGTLDAFRGIEGTVAVAPTGDAERRTIDLVMTPTTAVPLASWARAGVGAYLEVVVAGESDAVLAIPLSCVARDGTRSVIFRRDRADADRAIRMEADLGIDDGRWVAVRSGVGEGDEIVLDGVYQLMVATSGSITKGGHFHSDGTFHEGED